MDIFLTRFVTDSDFRSDEDFQYHAHTRAILELFITGGIYTGTRLKAAGMTQPDECCCKQHAETHQHLLMECPLYAATRPIRGEEKAVSWTAGIFFSPSDAFASERSRDHLPDLPEISETFSDDEPVFLDRSAFHEEWPALCSAACAVVVPGKFEMSVLLPGRDLTSQRAELYAAILALRLTHGSSHWSAVVYRATSFKQHGYRFVDFVKFDNHDFWAAFLEEVHKRPNSNISFVKVKAHVPRCHTGQAEYLTRGNELADRCAKRKARDALSRQELARAQAFYPESC